MPNYGAREYLSCQWLMAPPLCDGQRSSPRLPAGGERGMRWLVGKGGIGSRVDNPSREAGRAVKAAGKGWPVSHHSL